MNVVSYTLFGNYGHNAASILRACSVLFPSWQIRIHHDEVLQRSNLWPFLSKLQEGGVVKLQYAEPHKAKCRSMLWRMMPAWDHAVNYFICRDFDSLPTYRDRRAVEQFIASGAGAHAISDEPAHVGPFMGGMCGFKAIRVRERTGFQSWEQFISQRSIAYLTPHGSDQFFLNDLVWPVMRPLAFQHRFSGEHIHPGTVGGVNNLDGAPEPDDVPDLVKQTADSLCNYIGASGCYPARKVNEFYAQFDTPIMAEAIQLLPEGLRFS